MAFEKQNMNVGVLLICILIVFNKGFAGKDDPTSPSQQSETSGTNGTGESAPGSSEHDQDIQSQRELLRGMGIQTGTGDFSDTNMAPDVSVNNGNVTGSNQTSLRLPLQVSDYERPVEASENLGANRSSIYRYHRQPRYPIYSWETNRHGTFRGWPKEETPADLARAGFFYAGFGDNVKCFCCGGGLRNWERGDDPWVEHARWFPNCEFVRRNKGTASNRQHGLSELQRQQPTSRQSMNNEQGINGSSINHQLSDHRKYSHVASRQGTFRGWPKEKRQRPADLARAGFYYTGSGDTVKCFCCGGGLRNWELEDDPWVEHARWFPNCEFVRRNKGTAFIRQVQRHYNRPEEHRQQRQQRQHPTSRQSMNNKQGQYPVDEREVRARMDRPIVHEIINMGFPYKTVWAVIENRLRKTGDDFPDASSLLAAIFAFIDAEETIINESQLDERPSSATGTDDGMLISQTRDTEFGKDKKKIANDGKSSKDACHQADPQHDSTSLREENQRLREERMCKICMDEEASVVLLPCAHLACCKQCAPKVKKCPICETAVRGIVRAYLS